VLGLGGSREKRDTLIRTPAAGVSYNSPLITAMSAHLQKHPSAFVLDLGAARRANVEYYARFGAKVFVEDILAEKRAMQAEHGEEPSSVTKTFSEQTTGSTFDLIVSWDTLNYLTSTEALAMGKELGRLARPGALLHVMVWASQTMPKQPLALDVTSDEQVTYELSESDRVQAPRWGITAVTKFFPEFERMRTFLARSGLEEHLLVRKP